MGTGYFKDPLNPEGKVVLLLSGGIDSATVGAFLKHDEAKEIYPLVVSYGQKHSKEVEIAYKLAGALGFKEPVLVNLEGAFALMKSELLDASKDVTEEPHRDTVGSTYVPMRNTTLLSLAAGYAESIGASEVAYGAHKDDASDYPDCTYEYYNAMSALITCATNAQVSLRAPFIRWKKSDIVAQAAKLNVPLEMTWSCYNGHAHHCGKCPTCVARKEAFATARVKDPTQYE